MSENQPPGGYNAPPGPGWWLASDGNWYPPEQAPQQPAPPPVQQTYMAPPPQPVYVTNRTNGIATAGMVLGIVGICLFFIPFLGVILGILAVVFGAIGIGNAKKGHGNRSRAVSGIATGIVAAIVSVLFVGWAVQENENHRRDVKCDLFSDFSVSNSDCD
jgi:hypothetical protein